MYNDHDHDRISLRAPIIYQNNIFFGPMVLSFWPGGMPLFWAPTSPITVLANHSILSSVKCCGPELAHDRPANHGIAGFANYETRPAPRCV